MDSNKIEKLKEILSIQSFYGREEKVRQYIVEWASDRGIDYYIDKLGNVYLTKGVSEYYPCMVAHMDTVHKINTEGIEIVEETYVKTNLDFSSVCDGKQVLRGYLKGKPQTRKNRTGCGGDDKCGVFLALEVMDKFDIMKCAFFISEEIGCIGSKDADPKFFENVAYAIQHDSPENDTISWYCSGYLLFNEKWAKPELVYNEEIVQGFEGKIGDLLYKHGVRFFARHPFTDVSQLKKNFDFQCINLPAAYYHYHSVNECVLIEGIETAFNLSVEIIERLGNEKQEFEKQVPYYNNGYGNGGYYYNGSQYKRPISMREMKKKVFDFFKSKYNIDEKDFKFLYEGLYSYLDDFQGQDDVEKAVDDYSGTPFNYN